MLPNGPSLNLDKARFSGSILLSQPTLQIKQAHSLATAKLHSRQSALPVQSDNSCFLLRAEAPTRPPGLFILVFHLRDYPKSRRPSHSWLCLHGYPVSVLLLLFPGITSGCCFTASSLARLKSHEQPPPASCHRAGRQKCNASSVRRPSIRRRRPGRPVSV
jgi:hypothetical protein